MVQAYNKVGTASVMTEHDRALEAFHRLLADASGGGQAKVDALVALSQRTVLIPVWSSANDAFRTLVNPGGDAALPMFTSRALLQAAGQRFGWLEAGVVPHREVGARAALRHAVAHRLPFVVLDVASPHALEVHQSEIAPLVSPEARRESAGPYAGVGRLSSSMLQAVEATPQRATPPPDTMTAPAGLRPAASSSLPPTMVDRSRTARSSQPAPASHTDMEPDPTPDTGTFARGSTPIAHVLGERSRRTPRQQPRVMIEETRAPARESSRPPSMDPSGAYGAATRTRRQGPAHTPAGTLERPGHAEPRYTPASTPMRPMRTSGLHSDIPSGMGAVPGAVAEEPARITALAQTPPESLLDAFTVVLRNYPEVEWAAFCFAARPSAGPMPALALRIDDGFRQRVGEVVLSLRTAAAEEGTDVDVLLLDEGESLRAARTEGLVFYPWRRSPSRPGP
jgi:hypothetical protein